MPPKPFFFRSAFVIIALSLLCLARTAFIVLGVSSADGPVNSPTSVADFWAVHSIGLVSKAGAGANLTDGDQAQGTILNEDCNAAPTVVNIDDSGVGSLRQAINDACSGAAISFDTAGVFATPQTISLTSGGFIIDRPLTFNGTGAANLTVRRTGPTLSRLILIAPGGDVTINGMTWSGGSVAATNAGGGIYLDSASTALTMNDSGDGGCNI